MVEIRVEFIRAVESQPLIVADFQTVRECACVAANRQVPLPVWEEAAELTRIARDRIVDARSLKRSRN